MMEHRADAFSLNNQYRKATEYRRKFQIAGEWWADVDHKERKQNKPMPEFHSQWHQINKIYGDINDMELNSIIVPNSDKANEEGADLLMRGWRNDSTQNRSIEAKENATKEMVIGGFGCEKLVSKYSDEESPDDDEQYLCKEPIYDASNCVRFGVEAIEPDKSDAKRGWHLIKGDRESFEKKFNVERIVSFPNDGVYSSNQYDYQSNKNCYLAHYYEVVEAEIVEYDFMPLAQIKISSGDGIKGDDGKKYTRQELIEMKRIYQEQVGEPPSERRSKKKYVLYALADGEKYLTKPHRMPFKRVPLIPRYAYHSIIDGEEYFCGELEKKNDQEMYMNYLASCMMEILGSDQLEKPEYLAEQIAKHKSQRANQSRHNYPYLLSDPATVNGQTIVGPIGKYTPPQIGSGMMSAYEFLREREANSSVMGQISVPANASNEAIQSVNERRDSSLLPLVKACLHAERAMCETWIPAAQELYFSKSKSIRVMAIDGKYENVTTLEMKMSDDGTYGAYGNNPLGRYSVKVEQGEAYKDQRQAARESVMEMVKLSGTDTQYGQMLLMKASTLLDGEGTDDLRTIARYNMLDIMIANDYPIKAENEEEERYITNKRMQIEQQKMQAQQNDPMLIAAMAEDKAAMAENKKAEAQLQDKKVDMINAETARAKVQVDAYKAVQDVEFKKSKQEMDAALSVMNQIGRNLQQ